MSNLARLSKIYKKEVDKLASKILELKNKKEEILKLMHLMLNKLSKEIEEYGSNTMYAFSISQYRSYIKNEEKNIRATIADMEALIDKLQSELRDKYIEMKRINIVLQKELEEFQKEEKRRETKEIDEFYVIQHASNWSALSRNTK